LHRGASPDDARLPGNRVHLAHHENPDALDRLNVQLSESLPVCAAYCLLAWAATGSWRSMTFLYDGLMLGYFFYEYLDYQAHHGAARGPLIRYFRRYHLLHHHCDAEARFGVTTPLFDLVFGTYRVARKTSTQAE
jgi:dihydroceramide fatty acyl 2-hydroxylase